MALCLAEEAAIAPFYVFLGFRGIAHDEDEPPNPFPNVLITAFLMAVVWQAAAIARKAAAVISSR
jgi:hypothetical protein